MIKLGVTLHDTRWELPSSQDDYAQMAIIMQLQQLRFWRSALDAAGHLAVGVNAECPGWDEDLL